MIFFLKKGGERIIPLYKEPKNSPFLSNEQKQIYNKERGPVEEKPKQDEKKILDLQLYQQQKPKQDQQGLDPNKFLPVILPQYQTGYQGYYDPKQNPINMFQSYKINITGPNVDHNKVSLIYEDVLPGKDMQINFTTLGERILLHNYMRNQFYSKGDGSSLSLSGSTENCLLSRIRLIDIYPYKLYKSSNPYKDLPDDMLIYKTCYPIRLDERTHTVMCARDSTGVNVKIYKLTDDAYNITLTNTEDMTFYPVWREIMYYMYIKENVIKKYESPNFVLMYGYNIVKKCSIDFDKINMIRCCNKNINKEKEEYEKEKLLKEVNENYKKSNLIDILTNKKDTKKSNYTGKSVVALTEAPLYTLFGWATKTYQADGNVRKMITKGFYDDKIWYSVLFQLMVIFHILFKHKILFNNFNVDNNIFIKDLNVQGNTIRYWKYRISGIDYYVPNYGYLVMFDSSTKEIKENTDFDAVGNMLNIMKNKLGRFVESPNIFAKEKDGDDKDKYIKEKILEQFKSVFNTNIFSDAFIDFGGCKPSDEILKFLNKINNSQDKTIEDHIINNMQMFMHNRIGTPLKTSEINYKISNVSEFHKGDMIIYTDGLSDIFGLYLQTVDGGKVKIVTKEQDKDDKNKYVFKIKGDLNANDLSKYNPNETIQQEFKFELANLNESDLLETYIIRDD